MKNPPSETSMIGVAGPVYAAGGLIMMAGGIKMVLWFEP
jgi:hypothetical protein